MVEGKGKEEGRGKRKGDGERNGVRQKGKEGWGKGVR